MLCEHDSKPPFHSRSPPLYFAYVCCVMYTYLYTICVCAHVSDQQNRANTFSILFQQEWPRRFYCSPIQNPVTRERSAKPLRRRAYADFVFRSRCRATQHFQASKAIAIQQTSGTVTGFASMSFEMCFVLCVVCVCVSAIIGICLSHSAVFLQKPTQARYTRATEFVFVCVCADCAPGFALSPRLSCVRQPNGTWLVFNIAH